MDRHDQRGQLIRADVLELVDGKHDAGPAVASRLATRHQQVGHIVGEVPRIGDTPERLHVDGDSRPIGELQREGLEDAQRPGDRRRDHVGAEREQDPAEPGREERWKVTMLRRLDQADPKPLLLGDLTPQPDHQQALPRPARDGAAKSHPESIDEVVASRQRRRRRAGTRAVRIDELIHGFDLVYSGLVRF